MIASRACPHCGTPGVYSGATLELTAVLMSVLARHKKRLERYGRQELVDALVWTARFLAPAPPAKEAA